jgi:hypothetical protein
MVAPCDDCDRDSQFVKGGTTLTINNVAFAFLEADGEFSGTVSWVWQKPVTVTAQASIGFFGEPPWEAEVGFSQFWQNGSPIPIGTDAYGSWDYVLNLSGITQIDISVRVFDGRVRGSAVAYIWDS